MLQKGGQVTNKENYETNLKVYCVMIKFQSIIWHPLNVMLKLAS